MEMEQLDQQKTENCTINEEETLQTVFYWAQKSISNKTNKNTHDDDVAGDIDNKSSGNIIEFNGTRYKDVTVRPSNNYIGQSRYIIDEKGNGLLFTLRGSRVGGCCFPIKKNRISTTYLYTMKSKIPGYDRPIATLIDSSNQNLLRSVITRFQVLLTKPLQSLPVTEQHPTDNYEYKLLDGWKVNKKKEYTKHGAPLQTSLTFTDRYGNGKCIYTDGYIIPVENGQLVKSSGYPYPNGTIVFKELDKLVEDTCSCHPQQSQQAYKDLANKCNQINLYKGEPKPQQRRFGRHDVEFINNFTFSVSRDISTQKIVSIMITDKHGNGKCFYQDGYVNPVSNRQTFAELGKKQSLDVFKSLSYAIERHNSFALSDFLRTQNLAPNNNISPISSGQYYNQNIQQQNPRQFFSSINGQNNMQQNWLLQQYQNWQWQLQNRNSQQQQYNQQYNNYPPLVNNFINNNLYNVSNGHTNLNNVSHGYNNLHNVNNGYNNLNNVNNGYGL